VTAIAICPTTNTPGKKDVTGAFYPEARFFAKLHGADLYRFDNTASKRARRVEVETAIRGASGMIDTVAIFCHGHKNGLQTGHTTRSAQRLADAIAGISQPWVQVALYACDTARDEDRQRQDDQLPGPGGEGGFADALRDAMLVAGLVGGHVDAHTVTAHTTRAPYVRRFEVAPEQVGGEWLVEPHGALWNAWRRRLQKDRAFRLSFPRWARERVLAELDTLKRL